MVEQTSSERLQISKEEVDLKFKVIEEKRINKPYELTHEKFNFLLYILKHF